MLKIRRLKKTFGNTTVLKDVNLDISEGEIVVIVGPYGGGKTTLIRLLLNLIHSQHGDITLQYNDETPIKITKEHRDLISYVPQGNTLFSGTIKNNLLLANKNATDSELDNAIRQAGAYDFIQELFSKGATIEVLEPQSLRDVMRSEIKKMQKLYGL